jgi:hypothetical protein
MNFDLYVVQPVSSLSKTSLSRLNVDDVEKGKILTLLELELRFLNRSARSQSLYGLHYPGSTFTTWRR